MIPAFLITFREVLEAFLIVAAILAVLTKLGHKKGIRTVWLATMGAFGLSLFILTIGSIFGFSVQELFDKHEQYIEGSLEIISAIFITWAVFFLHQFLATYKIKLLQKIKKSIENQEQKGLFILVFTAVLREGLEIVLFLSTIYFSSKPQNILAGFVFGVMGGLIVAFYLFNVTIKLKISYAFRMTSIFLIIFAAGLLARGIHEFTEIGFLPEVANLVFAFIPDKTTFIGNMFNSMFGITQKMSIIQLICYIGYITFMSWRVFGKNEMKLIKKVK